MKILHVARHGSGGNDDEGAIAHALTVLGHEVIKVYEGHLPAVAIHTHGADFLLFHKWYDPKTLKILRDYGLPTVFWYFDRVFEPNDPSVRGRNLLRQRWMEHTLPYATLGFCTDGDWVSSRASQSSIVQEHASKLRWLTQGADERIIGKGEPRDDMKAQLLFFGTWKGNGQKRDKFLDLIRREYGDRFLHIRSGAHGRYLADVIASVPIVIAPDGPCSDRYWSNRVYLVAGFGGFLFHPACRNLTSHYAPESEVVYYQNREQLHREIQYFLQDATRVRRLRSEIGLAAFKRTQKEHLYRHRCERLIEEVRKELGR